MGENTQSVSSFDPDEHRGGNGPFGLCLVGLPKVTTLDSGEICTREVLAYTG